MDKDYRQLLAEMKNPPPADHPWAVLLKETLRQANESQYEALEADGELEAYVRWRTGQMLEAYDSYIEDDYDEAEAKELAFDDWLPKAEQPIVEDWELEGAAEDEAAAMEDFLDGLG